MRQVTVPPSYLNIGIGGHFEGFGGLFGRSMNVVAQTSRFEVSMVDVRIFLRIFLAYKNVRVRIYAN